MRSVQSVDQWDEGQVSVDQSEAGKLTGITKFSTRWFKQLHINLCQSWRWNFRELRFVIKEFVIEGENNNIATFKFTKFPSFSDIFDYRKSSRPPVGILYHRSELHYCWWSTSGSSLKSESQIIIGSYSWSKVEVHDGWRRRDGA